MSQGKLIVIDGMDGSGKGTQISMIEEKFPEFIWTREPGGCPISEDIRGRYLVPIFTEQEFETDPLTDFYLFWAARVAHLNQVVVQEMEKGKCVISDRFDSSTWAFQICGEEQPILKVHFEQCRSIVMKGIDPVYIFLDLPPEVAHKRRMADHEQEKSRFDVKSLEYHQRVRKGFQSFGDIESVNSCTHLVDANRSPEDVFQDVTRLIESI